MCVTQAEGKVDNYIDLADISPYPCKNRSQERVSRLTVVSHAAKYSRMRDHYHELFTRTTNSNFCA